ncbi:MAG: hypothetical protein CFE39_17555, partial [Comamonadaceae bacterium PBBC2]
FAPVATTGRCSCGFSHYTATFTPTASSTGTALIGVVHGKFSDAAANLNKDTYVSAVAGTTQETNNLVAITFDTTSKTDATAPTIAITSDVSSLLENQTATITFTLSEASKDFTLADITVSGGTLSNLTGSGANYTATFTPDLNSTANGVIQVKSGTFSDALGNINADGADANNTVSLNVDTRDVTPPTIALTSDKTKLLAGQTSVITFTLSEPSKDFTLSDITVRGASLSNLTPVATTGNVNAGYTQYTAVLTPLDNSTADSAVYVPSSSFSDPVGNLNVDGADVNNTVIMTTDTRDVTSPTIAIASDKTTLKAGDTANITFTLSEIVGDFQDSDITVAGGTLSALVQSSTDPKVYTAVFTPYANSIAASSIFVDSAKLSDAAGNYNTDGADANNTVLMSTNTVVVDTTTPTIAIARTGSGTLTSTETITFTLSEISNNFALSDIDVNGGKLSNFTPVPTSGTPGTGYTQYTATFTPNASSSGNATIGVASSRFSDAAGNLNKDTYVSGVSGVVQEANNQVTIAFNTTNPAPSADTTAPTIIVARSGAGTLTTGTTELITFTLSEASTSFAINDIDVTGGNLTNLSAVGGSGDAIKGFTQYVATFTPNANANGVASIGVASGKFGDAAGNLNLDTYQGGVAGSVQEANNQIAIAFDSTGKSDLINPTIALSSDKLYLREGDVATITFTLSEVSTDFTLADVKFTGGTLSNFSGSGKVYTATFTPDALSKANSVITVESVRFQDASGNFNVDGADANNTLTLSTNTFDTTPPTIAVTSSKTQLLQNQTALITFTLSEAVSDFAASDVTVSGGTLSGFAQSLTDPKVYTATFTPATNSTATSVISVASTKFSDAAGNFNADGAEANNRLSMSTDTRDLVPPTIVVTADQTALKAGQVGVITFTLSEDSADFTLADVSATGGTLSNFTGSGKNYTATFTPTAGSSGSGTVSVASAAFADAAGNQNADGADTNNTVSMSVDTSVPTIAISSNKTFMKAGDTATISFTLSEASTDFSSADVTVSGGTLSNFSGSGTSYTATFTPTAGSTADSVISVASNKFSDAAGNFNTDGAEANNSITMSTDTVPPTVAITSDKSTLKVGETATITFALSESATDFTAADVAVTGGTLSNFTGSGTSYTATFTPTAGSTGNGTVFVDSDKFSDAAGNLNKDGAEANNTLTIASDTAAPSISITTDKTLI